MNKRYPLSWLCYSAKNACRMMGWLCLVLLYLISITPTCFLVNPESDDLRAAVVTVQRLSQAASSDSVALRPLLIRTLGSLKKAAEGETLSETSTAEGKDSRPLILVTSWLSPHLLGKMLTSLFSASPRHLSYFLYNSTYVSVEFPPDTPPPILC